MCFFINFDPVINYLMSQKIPNKYAIDFFTFLIKFNNNKWILKNFNAKIKKFYGLKYKKQK